MRTSLVALATATVLAGCATTPPPTLQTGPNAEVTVDGLHRVDNSRVQMAWMKPDVDLRGYTAVMLDPVFVAYKKDPQGRSRAEQVGTGEPNFALSATQMENFKSWFHEAVVEAFSDRGAYRVTDTPGPDVLRISADLIDLVVRVPTARTGGRSQTLTRSFGAVTLVVEIRDSESGEILARAGDRGDPASLGAGNVSEVSPSLVKADTQRLFRYWAEIMKERLDELREVEG